MNLEQQKYIKQNRTKESMLTMAKCLGISYNKVRNYMILKNLQVSQDTVFKIRSLKKRESTPNKKPWNWDALA
jgi:sugar diacid utilization regulator